MDAQRGQEGFQLDMKEGVELSKIDKGCLVINTKEEQGYDVMIFDNQNRGEEAQYWKETFLGLTAQQNEFHHTSHFLSLTKQFITEQLETELKIPARLLEQGKDSAVASAEEVRQFWEIAAAEHDRHAQLAVGLWCARMQVDGRRVAVGTGSANFKKAIRWLTLAGEQGLAEAWYALSRIYIKPEFSQRNVGDAQRYLERAADMGYREAQLECGHSAWRARRENESNDVRAVYWLQKAAAQGSAEASEALDKIAPRGQGPAYAWCAGLKASRNVAASHPLLAARLELAALFHLTRAEALLIDIKSADQGHCLVVDIRASYGRSKRRLVALASAHERQTLDRIGKLFDNVDCGPNGPEGNYRQRLYRLKTLVPELAGAEDSDAEAYEMAA